ncbi:MAG: T9SS type A sorting domain-containing protein [Bacteroidota bacterium]
MKTKLLVVAGVLLSIMMPSQTCQDGFETNSFLGWTGAIGQNNGNYSITITSLGTPSPNFAIETSTLIPCSNTNSNPGVYEPLAAPGFDQYSARLGQQGAVGSVVEILTYSFTPTVNDTDFLFVYSTYLEAPGHGPTDNPYFVIGMLDQNGDTIPGSFYMYQTGTPSTAGFDTSACFPYLFFKPWTIRGVNLAPYAGQQVVLFAINSDCYYGGHYAYSYIDMDCDGFLTVPAQSTVLLNARSEAGSTYLWNTGATTNTILLNNPAPNSIYTCTVTLSANFAPANANTFVVKYKIIGTTSIEEKSNQEIISFYPNPARNVLYIQGQHYKNIKMYDILGNEIKLNFIDDKSINISHLSDGIYFVKFFDNGEEKILKVMVQN